jgi:hypothetical protein
VAARAAPQAGSSVLRSLQAFWAISEPAAAVLGMFAYLLVLGSVAVVLVTGRFPWFTVAPAVILLGAAHVRHLEARWERQGGTRPT